MASRMITTDDNPFNPFTQFDEWYAYDEALGYHTCSYLARIVKYSDDMSEADVDFAIEEGVNDILQMNILGIYRSVEEPSDIQTG
jgi:hypothetical protein